MPQPINSYPIGQQLLVQCQFLSLARVLTDPSLVTLQLKLPDGTTQTHVYPGGDGNVFRETTGSYGAYFTISQAGTHSYRWSSSGTITAAAEWTFIANVSAFF